MIFYVSYMKKNILQGMVVDAPTAKLAERYFYSREPHVRFISAREATPSEQQSGVPVLTLTPEEASSLRESFLASGLEDLDFSVRTYNCLRKAGIDTIGDLVGKTADDIEQIRSLGRKSREEIHKVLFLYGETLSPSSLNASDRSTPHRLADAIDEAEAKQQFSAAPSHEMHESVVSVALSVENEDVRNSIFRSDQLRYMTLDTCYKIPGYMNLDKEDAKKLYDLVHKALSSVHENHKGSATKPELAGR